jgi:hypothetical protein
MLLASFQPADESPRYSFAELLEIRRRLLRYARSLPPGPDRNQHWQVAISLRRLFRDQKWRDDHTVGGLQVRVASVGKSVSVQMELQEPTKRSPLSR